MIKLIAKANWKEHGAMQDGTLVYTWSDLKLLVSGDYERKLVGWHISISHPYRYPTWDEIYTARYDFCPAEINMAIFLPRKSEYVNIHPNCFHVHQVQDAELPEGLLL